MLHRSCALFAGICKAPPSVTIASALFVHIAVVLAGTVATCSADGMDRYIFTNALTTFGTCFMFDVLLCLKLMGAGTLAVVVSRRSRFAACLVYLWVVVRVMA